MGDLSHLRSPAIWQFVQQFVQDYSKANIKDPDYCPFVQGIPWFPPQRVSNVASVLLIYLSEAYPRDADVMVVATVQTPAVILYSLFDSSCSQDVSNVGYIVV